MSFFDNLEKYKDSIAVIDDNSNKYSYEKLINCSEKVASYFSKRDIVFLICENSFEFLSCYVGLIRKKIVIFLIDKSLNENNLSKLIDIYKPKYLLVPFDLKISEFKKKQVQINNKYKLYFTKYKKISKIDKNLALLISTSGTTGSPKFVKLSYENILNNTQKISEYLNIKKNHRAITTLQPQYSYGLSIINSHLIKGSSIIMTDKTLLDKNFWELLKKEKASTFGGVPFIFEILSKLKFSNMNLPSLKYLTQAGGKLQNNLLKEFNSICIKKKIKLIVMYGQTEASPRMSYLEWKYANKKIGSIGKALKGGTFELYDEKNKKIKKNNQVGELAYIGKNIMLGYANNSKDLQKNKKLKVLFTGDLGYRDKDGFYFLVGRKSRYIKIYGVRVSLNNIEEELNKKNINNAVVGEDNKLKIFIEDNKKTRSVLEILKNQMSIKKNIIEIIAINKIPRNVDGKIIYVQLKEKN